MATRLTGREIILAAKRGSAWGTAVECGAGDGILVTSESFGAKAPKFLDDDSLGQADIKETYLVAESLKGSSIEGYLRFEGWDTLLALCLGSSGTPAAQEATSTAYGNQYYPADNIDDFFATLAAKKAGTAHGIWEIPSGKITGFTITGAVGELTKITLNFDGSNINTESAVNTSTTMASVTYPTTSNIARIDSNFYMWMNAQSGGSLTAANVIYPNSFTITYNRPMDEPYEAGSIFMKEPTQDGFAEATIQLVFDKYEADTFLDAITDETDQKMRIGFVGDTIAGSETYIFEIYIPKITWNMAEAPASGPGKIGLTVSGKLYAVDSAPTGMESTDDIGINCVDPLVLWLVNTNATDPLA